MGIKVTAIFDIGKTNKKFFLFDEHFKEVYRQYTSFKEIADEDGHPTEDIQTLIRWIKETFEEALLLPGFEITALNFSSYGASLVHLDASGNVLTPLYNYTKPMEPNLVLEFYKTFGPEKEFYRTTGSSNAGMLNSGMQLYWLLKTQPERYAQIARSLHLPQYLSYLFTGEQVSEYTSIGCHTALWDHVLKSYHPWVKTTGILHKFPRVVPSKLSFTKRIKDREIKIGVGIHDSSAALYPYIEAIDSPFVLLSTGTWNVALNPDSSEALADADLEYDTILYMQPDGRQVRATRLFMGREFELQLEKLREHFQLTQDKIQHIIFDKHLAKKLLRDQAYQFRWEVLKNDVKRPSATSVFKDFITAYHRLLIELVGVQLKYLKTAIGSSKITTLCIDGGFAKNEVFIHVLKLKLPHFTILTATEALGSALGSALMVSEQLEKSFIRAQLGLKSQNSEYNQT